MASITIGRNKVFFEAHFHRLFKHIQIDWIYISNIYVYIYVSSIQRSAILQSISNLIEWILNEFKWFMFAFVKVTVLRKKNRRVCNHKHTDMNKLISAFRITINRKNIR